MTLLLTRPATQSEDGDETYYPESDGKPLADNTKQDRWITYVKSGFAALYRDDADVFVGGNLLWYPVRERNDLVAAPDVFVVFGRPNTDRSSYRQWQENNTPMQVVWEILSPSNTPSEMTVKALFYDTYGVEEYYIYDPHKREFDAFLRSEVTGRLEPVAKPMEMVSPRTGVRFALAYELMIFRPDGEPFKVAEQLIAERNAAQAERDAARGERDAAQSEAERLRAKLLALGINPDAP